MFILNRKNGNITECKNEDVIAHCKKHPNEYRVVSEAAELQENPTQESTKRPDKTVNSESLNALEAPEGPNEIAMDAEGKEEIDYASMSVIELRKVAREKGIQGYANMNKETLVEVIKAHE